MIDGLDFSGKILFNILEYTSQYWMYIVKVYLNLLLTFPFNVAIGFYLAIYFIHSIKKLIQEGDIVRNLMKTIETNLKVSLLSV